MNRNDENVLDVLDVSDVLDITEEDNGSYRIGMGFLSETNDILVETAVPLSVFYGTTTKTLRRWLIQNSTTPPNWKRVEIMKMEFKTVKGLVGYMEYTCVFKTYYLRIVQRRWKTIFRERQQFFQNTKRIIQGLREQQTKGKTLVWRQLPSIRGMLA